ncbi:class I SAM-dependent methyltransferase [Chitinophaga solisilvae]|uniref:Class I SAM-dependent methyltransferase n=1 Tax=Chitinophaga solisilvae TaxID=1233460 RepID=A0A433WEA6_9BACT|nr:class I SAM-dependent methyltransferase [Chitinophaga solisilvae]NSL86846.1 class I SAM-dependent methyltransferase [Chitinophaga solisilvae]
MKLSNPASRSDLHIKRKDKVLEVGGGDHPHPRANVVVDKYVDSNFHRGGNIRVLRHQEFLNADGEALPFEDKSFDYVICSHVLEHVDNPIKFMSEQMRVAPAGYLETPSVIGECLMPKASHRWVLLEIDDKIVMYEKEKIGFQAWQDLSYVFQHYLPENSIGYKIMQRTHADLTIVNYEWSEKVELLINPDSTYYSDYFTQPWDEAACNKFLTQRSLGKESVSSARAMLDIIRSVFRSRVLKRG